MIDTLPVEAFTAPAARSERERQIDMLAERLAGAKHARELAELAAVLNRSDPDAARLAAKAAEFHRDALRAWRVATKAGA
jgi:hypothetical protein